MKSFRDNVRTECKIFIHSYDGCSIAAILRRVPRWSKSREFEEFRVAIGDDGDVTLKGVTNIEHHSLRFSQCTLDVVGARTPFSAISACNKKNRVRILGCKFCGCLAIGLAQCIKITNSALFCSIAYRVDDLAKVL